MNGSLLSKENEFVLHYLFTSERAAHTVQSLRSVCSDGDVDEALVGLVAQGYIFARDKHFELTEAGICLVQKIHPQPPMPALPPTKMQPSGDDGAQSDMPGANAHPLRKGLGRPRGNRAPERRTVDYLLAFETPANGLPVPVFDGDILGRLSEATITLSQDEYITGHHCCFKVEIENGQSVLYIQDLDSRNGTYLDGVPLKPCQWYELAHGNRIQVGTSILIVVQVPR